MTAGQPRPVVAADRLRQTTLSDDLVRWAHFPYNKGLEQFDFSFQPSIDERKLRELAGPAFLERKENIPLVGPPGVGKTHLAIALGTEAIGFSRANSTRRRRRSSSSPRR